MSFKLMGKCSNILKPQPPTSLHYHFTGILCQSSHNCLKMRFFSLFPWFLLITTFSISCIGIIPVHCQCLHDQRNLLLQLKNSLNFDSLLSTKLVLWNQSTDCCRWSGITCDNLGHVISLDLSFESIYGGIHNASSLFNLRHIQRLNLAYNDFQYATISTGFEKLTNLIYLNLSNSYFSGQIPIGISHLNKLVTLDLSITVDVDLPLKLERLEWLVQNLTELTELHLDSVNILAEGWCQALSSSLPNLRVLSLSGCHLRGPICSSLAKLQSLSVIDLSLTDLSCPVPNFFASYTNLTVLRLSSCELQGTFPVKIFQIPTLQEIDLSYNGLLEGSLPEFPQNGSLQTLILSYTNFSGRLPNSIGNLGKLSRTELDKCRFSGLIPSSVANLTQLVYLGFTFNMFTGSIPSFQMSTKLTHIDFSVNNLTGPIRSTHFEGLSNLVHVDLSCNSLNGSIPSALFSLPSLKVIQLSSNQFAGQVDEILNASSSGVDTLDLSSNNLEGPIPISFFEMERLNTLSLSSNNFSGLTKLETIHRLRNLTTLDLSYNHLLSVDASDSNVSLSSFPQFEELYLASCNLQSFPDLRNQSKLTYLDLSDNQIDGEIPNWIWEVGKGSLSVLNLSHNLLVDMQKPFLIPDSLNVLDLHSNQLNREIPIPPASAGYLDFSSNNFNSSIPVDIGKNVPFVYFFSLSNNSLTGTIPQSVCNLGFQFSEGMEYAYLQFLDLSENGLFGAIPPCLIEKSNYSTLEVLNLRNNKLSGNVSGTFPRNCSLKTLDLSGNQLEGQVPESLANCKMLEILNLGNNKLNDTFPCFLMDISSLSVLILRSNRFQGNISCQGGNNGGWPNLQIIDIAFNNLSGYFPTDCFVSWSAMMDDEDNSQSSESNHFEFQLTNHLYYRDTVTVTNKGSEMELVKILVAFKAVDFSSNKFEGMIPDTIGNLKFLIVLNLSHNALAGTIPASMGKLRELESLDLSKNKLSGEIPEPLASLSFLSFFNVSCNLLVGRIPGGSQIQTFSETSFLGNQGLCGFPLNISCSDNKVAGLSPTTTFEDRHSFLEAECYESVALGFVVGLGVISHRLCSVGSGDNGTTNMLIESSQKLWGGEEGRGELTEIQSGGFSAGRREANESVKAYG